MLENMRWNPTRPTALVVACSDGRLQEATDAFLERDLHITHYDRLYVPGGAGALTSSGRDFARAHELQRECRYLVDLHGLLHVIAIFHGPARNGPDNAICADYRRKFPFASPADVRAQQEADARALISYRWDWAKRAEVQILRCEIGAHGVIHFESLHADAFAHAATW